MKSRFSLRARCWSASTGKNMVPLPVGITKGGRWLHYTGPLAGLETNTWADDPAQAHPCMLSPDRGRHELVVLDGCITRLAFDAAFPVLHGKNGEDGTVQGLLELAGIPIIGCGTLAGALAMDKDRAHKLAQLAGVRVPASAVFGRTAEPDAIARRRPGSAIRYLSSRCAPGHPSVSPRCPTPARCPRRSRRPSGTTAR